MKFNIVKENKSINLLLDIINKYTNLYIKKKENEIELIKINSLKTLMENSNIPISYRNESINILNKEMVRLNKENENVSNIVNVAYNELKNNNNNNITKDLDEDWLINFFYHAKRVNLDDIQYIFGKILAGEISNPGTYSKRLLNILIDLSKEEAESFTKVASLTLNDDNHAFIVSNENILNKYNVTAHDIILLDEAKLINLEELTMSEANKYEYNGYLIDLFNDYPVFYVFVLTKAGKELVDILNKGININYLKDIIENYEIKALKYTKIIEKKGKDNYILDEKDENIVNNSLISGKN